MKRPRPTAEQDLRDLLSLAETEGEEHLDRVLRALSPNRFRALDALLSKVAPDAATLAAAIAARVAEISREEADWPRGSGRSGNA